MVEASIEEDIVVENGVACPACGYSFVPPAGSISRFCPACGAPLTLNADAVTDTPPAVMSPEEAQERAARAIEQAARAAELAVQAARLAEQASSRLEATELAQRATAEAAGALHVAQASQRVQEQYLKDANERLAAHEAASGSQETSDTQTTAKVTSTTERMQSDACRQASESVAVQAPGVISGPDPTTTSGPNPEPTQTHSGENMRSQAIPGSEPRQVRYRQGATVRHTDGRGLFVLTLPADWSIRESGIRCEAARPYNPHVSLRNGRGASINLFQGDTGMRLSEAMKSLMATYGTALAGADRTNYAEVPNPNELADAYVRDIVRRVGASGLHLADTIDAKGLVTRRQEALSLFQENARASAGAIVCDPLAAEALRIYRFVLNGEDTGYAVHVRLYATKDGSGVESMNPMGLALNVGSAIGGLFRKRKAAKAKRETYSQTASSTWSEPDFTSYVSTGTIYWEVVGIATLSAPAGRFDEALNEAFLPMIASYELHPDMRALALGDTRQQASLMQQATNREVQANNMRTQASMAAARQAQAAADARFDQWMRDSDAHHAAFRERTNAPFSTSGASSASDYSEAIRGVNTYRTTDGREVEIDVAADRAWENQAGDVIGTGGAFEPGYDWTEIPRA